MIYHSPMRIIDSHVHFWRIGGPGQTWLGPEWPLLYRDFGPPELAEALSCAAASVTASASVSSGSAPGAATSSASPPALDVHSVVLVQSQPDDRDTDWLLGLAADLPLVAAVVGWVDLASPSAPARIAALASDPQLPR